MGWLGLLAVCLAAAPLQEAERRGHQPIERAPVDDASTLVLVGGTVMTATGEVFAPGYLALAGGSITAVGPGSPPADVEGERVEVVGRWVTPGLIDSHSHLGVYPVPDTRAHHDGNEMTAPVSGGVWAEHALWPQDPGFERALAGGVTALQVLPGSANLIGGRGFVVQNLPTRGSRAMRFPGAPDTLKMACGENPKRVYGDRKLAPSTRMGNLRGQRQAFLDAEDYALRWQRYAAKRDAASSTKKSHGDPPSPPVPPKRDLDLESLVGVLRGDILVQFHCYQADDMLAALQLSDEMGFEVRSFHHALEAYKIRDLLAAHGVAVSTWADWWGFKMEAYDGIPENAALLTEAGVRAIIHSDSAVGIQRLNQEAGKALAAGRAAGIPLTDDQALRWVTANPAWALGIDATTGSLTVGKRADVVVWDHQPFSVYASAEQVFIAGVLRYVKGAEVLPWSDYELGQELP